MIIWVLVAVVGAVVLAGIAFVALRREEERSEWERPRHDQPWDKRPDEPEGSRLASIPPPSGIPISSPSEEIPLVDSQELPIDDDEPSGPIVKMVVAAHGATDRGREREHNEDSFLVFSEHEVYAVADGMGGYAAGEVASELAVETLRQAFESGELPAIEGGLPRRGAELMAVITRANARIRQAARDDERLVGMGTTLVAARFSPTRKRVYIAHVGDSRCYRLRDDSIEALTTDHTLSQMGIRGPSGAKLSRAVGAFENVEVDLTIDEPQIGDYYLLCSDGLSKFVPKPQILETVREAPSLDEAVAQLIQRANDRGGRDNVTLVLVRIDDPEFAPNESGEHRLPGG